MMAEQSAAGGSWVETNHDGLSNSTIAVAKDANGLRTIFHRGTNLQMYFKEETSPGIWQPGWAALGGVIQGFSNMTVGGDGSEGLSNE